MTNHHQTLEEKGPDSASPPHTQQGGSNTTDVTHNVRKKRSDAGKPHGPLQPRKASSVTPMNDGTVLVALTGRHGRGKHLRVSKADLPDLMAFTDNGKQLHVVVDGKGTHSTLCIHGPKAQAWKHSTNPSDLVTVARFLVGETHGGRRIHCKDHDPFNLTRDNLEVLVPAIEETFTIDWEKAVAARQTKMQSCLGSAQWLEGEALTIH